MGSDLYMEQQNWRPRKTLVEWLDEETIKVQRDAFYTGYFTVYEGKVTPEVTTLLKGLGISLPEKPKDEDDPIKVLATRLHELQCNLDHTEGCAWYYEVDNKDGWGKNRWVEDMRAHKRWYQKAKTALKKLPGYSAEDIVAIAEVIK